jgi:hypothetical protein
MTTTSHPPLPPIEGLVIMRNTYYNPTNLRATIDWARTRLARGNCSAWEIRYLQEQIARRELALQTGRAS